MKIIPQYALEPGTKITVFSQEWAVNRRTEHGFELTNLESGNISAIRYEDLATLLKMAGTKLELLLPMAGSSLQRLGGYVSAAGLPEKQQDHARFLFCICQAMRRLQNEKRIETGDPLFHLSGRKMDEDENRRFVRKHAAALFGEDILLGRARGGKRTAWFLPRGRTLMEHFSRFENLKPGEDPLDALVPLDHFKGNRRPRIGNTLKRLMKQALEDVGLDLKGLKMANVMKHLKVLLRDANVIRKLNGLHDLQPPSLSTLSRFRDELLRPTERLGATKGERYARNKRLRGSTDVRALCIGELVEIDECKLSLVSTMRAKEVWHCLSSEYQAALEKIDQEIRTRLTLLVMLDVASKMVLAWVLSEQPKAEATLELLRMATRDKTREKIIYGCTGDPAPPVGLGKVMMDNGTGLRNAEVIGALTGVGATTTTARTYSPDDKPNVERVFDTLEDGVISMLHGYTGRKAGDLPGYDAKANGVLVTEELHGILSRYFIDEYPSTPHMGVGMGGRRPAEVFKYLNETRGIFRPVDRITRLIQMGWKRTVTPNDEGVRVFGGLWYSSEEFQRAWDSIHGAVTVFVDPDDLRWALVLVPGIMDPFEVELQITAFADLTLTEVLDIMEAWRKEHPDVTDIHEDRIMDTRERLFQQMRAIGVERGLGRSYSTVEECQNKGDALFDGVRISRAGQLPGTAIVGRLTEQNPDFPVYRFGADDPVIDGTVADSAAVDPEPTSGFDDPTGPTTTAEPSTPSDRTTPAGKRTTTLRKRGNSARDDEASAPLDRPKDIRRLE